MGVLSEIAAEKMLVSRRVAGNIFYFEDYRAALPHKVREWAGIKNRFGEMKDNNSLVFYNDKMENSFHEIADIIERNWRIL